MEVNEIIEAEVVDIKPYAAFLKFDNDYRGLLHISEISDKYVRDIESFVSIGDKINVLILSIDEADNFVRVSYKRVPSDKAFSTHKNTRVAPKIDEDDFAPLKEKLPEWISEAIKEKEENK